MNVLVSFKKKIVTAVIILIICTVIMPLFAQDQLGVITRKLPGRRMRHSSGLFDPESNRDSFHLKPHETVVLAELEGPGEIQHIWFTIGAEDRRYPRSLVFRIYWDDAEIPSVESPLGDFFAAGNGMRTNVSTLPIEVTSYGRAMNSYWKMPFHRKAKLTMTNESDGPVYSCYFYIDWVKHEKLPSNSLYFHARYNQEWPVKEFSPYTVVEINGSGQYVGTILSLHSSVASWFGESDDHFYIDGEEIPSLVGTGYEDYFTDAWNLRMFSNLNAGITIREWNSEDARITGYRWHIQDPIQFDKSLKMDVERRSYIRLKNNREGELYDFKYRADFLSSVSFWYQSTAADRWKPFPSAGKRLMPEVWVEPRAMAAGESDDKIEVSPGLKPESVYNRAGWKKAIFYTYNDKAGAWLEIPAHVKEEGRYSISVFQNLFREHGIWKVSLKGSGLNEILDPHMDFYDPYISWKENYPENEIFGTIREKKVGVFDLKPGRYTFRFECVGTNPQTYDKKTGGNGYSIRIDAISLRKLPWDNMGAWLKDYLAKEKRLFTKRIAEAERIVAEFSKAVEEYKKDFGKYPETLDALIAGQTDTERTRGRFPYIRGGKIPLDPWKQHFQYKVPGMHNPDGFDLWSFHGNSRKPDVWIGNWKK